MAAEAKKWRAPPPFILGLIAKLCHEALEAAGGREKRTRIRDALRKFEKYFPGNEWHALTYLERAVSAATAIG